MPVAFGFSTDVRELLRKAVVIPQEELERIARAKARRAANRKLGWYERAFAMKVECIKDAYAREQAVRASVATLIAQGER